MEGLMTERYRVGSLPTIFYIPEYVSPAEESQLLSEVRSSKAKWTQVSGRRLQNYGGVVHAKGCLIQQTLPSWLDRLAQRIHRSTGVYGEPLPNHVLVNSYQPGEGIMPHEDGPLYHPGVCILSLGAPAVLSFTRKRNCGDSEEPNDGPVATEDGDNGSEAQDGGPAAVSVACMPRSLLVFRDEAYTDCLHGIREVAEETIGDLVANREAAGLGQNTQVLPRGGERISLTVRRVLRVQKNLLMRL